MVSLNPDGSKDSSFNVGTSIDAYVTIDWPTDIVADIAIQEDGKILVVARSNFYQGENWGVPLRINADGSVDEDFELGVSFSHGWVNKVAVQSDGKILVGGSFSTANVGGEGAQPQNRIMRLHPNGGKDFAFDINEGHEPASGGFYQEGINDIVIDPDGKIWVGGAGNGEAAAGDGCVLVIGFQVTTGLVVNILNVLI